MIRATLKKALAARSPTGSGPIDAAIEQSKRLASVRYEPLLALAEGHQLDGSPRKALAALVAADGTWSNGRPILRRIVQLSLAVGDFAQCRAALDRLIELTPDDPALHLHRTVVANQTGDAFLYWRSLERATELYRHQALAGDIDGLCGLLAALIRKGEREQSNDILRVVVAHAQSQPSAATIQAATNALVATGDLVGLASLADGIDVGETDDDGRAAFADLLVRLERRPEALALIEQLQPTSKLRSDLLAWAAMQAGEVDSARRLHEQFSFPNTLDHLRVYSTELPLDLEPVGTPPSDLSSAIAITMTCNELPRLPEFFDHYRKLGFRHFLVIDNESDDGTREYLLDQPDTFVFTSSGDFRLYASGRRWVNHLIETYGTNAWNFVVDADELLVFPDDHLGVDQLVARLDATDAQVMFGLAIDMHAERLDAWNDYVNPHPDAPLVDRFPYFDARTKVIGSRHAPYLGVAGGLRNQQLAKVMPENLLTKPMAVRGGHGVRYLNPHLTNPARPSNITAAVLHYKFAVNPKDRIDMPSAKGVFMQFLAQNIAATRDITLLSDNSTRFEGASQLVEMGLLRTP